jgi:surface protein
MLYGCNQKLTEIPQFDTSKVTNMNNMLGNCKVLETVPELDASSATDIGYMFAYDEVLVNFGGLKNLGMQSGHVVGTNNAFSNCKSLSHDSVMNIINNLYDRASAGYSVLTLKLHSNSLALLTDEEKAIATNKGWTLS